MQKGKEGFGNMRSNLRRGMTADTQEPTSKIHSLRAFLFTLKKNIMQKRNVKMEVVNPNAAGIDVGDWH